MQITISDKSFNLDVYGFSGVAVNKDYAGTAFKLMGDMWQIVKADKLKNKGMNIWIYEPGERVFAGVELEVTPPQTTRLEQKNITLPKYAYYKHVGPYNLIKQSGIAMNNEIQKMGFETVLPYVEIYGHWTNDESKLETELYMCLK